MQGHACRDPEVCHESFIIEWDASDALMQGQRRGQVFVGCRAADRAVASLAQQSARPSTRFDVDAVGGSFDGFDVTSDADLGL